MGGVEDSQNPSSADKSRSKISLCKLLTQRKARVGCFRACSKDDNADDGQPENVPQASSSPTRNLFRGYSDMESRTTRLSLCCAVTESNSQTPPHSHMFSVSPQVRIAEENSGHSVQTREMASQTTNSHPGTPKERPCTPEMAVAEMYSEIIRDNTNEKFRTMSQCSLSRVVSCPPSPLKSPDDLESTTSTSSSSRNSAIRKVLSQRLSADNLMLSTGSGPELSVSASKLKEIRRRSSSQVVLRSNTAPEQGTDNENDEVSMDSLARQALLAAQVLHLIPTDKARERNFLQGRIAANSLLGPAELERVLPNREIRVFVGTWNMNGQSPPHEINDFMLPEGLEHVPDIIAIGTQESYPERFEWEVKIQETIGPSHVLFHSTALGTIHLAIFIRRDLLWFCSIAEESSLSVRPGVAFRTKGAVAIAFILFGTSFLFITAHLTAHQEKVKARIHDVKRIVRSLDLPKNLPVRFRIKSKDVTQNFDCVFWCGDLNFRLAQAREDVIHWVEEYKFPLQVDLKTDQLTKLITDGTCLSSFSEGSITFPPTYKYDPGTQNFDTSNKHRTPAYTDRILYKSKSGVVSCIAYSSVPSICTSDHKPVWGLYKGSVRPGIDTIPLTAGLFNREVYLEGIKRRAAELGRRDLGLSAVCSIQ
ncbi:UNVERIFIED_CONTAM: hypothetical protein PYX00_000898 [Menopon gallinae]|uniref:phosphoinositide 5-phosphatase n=1 Tax=Menopon gallinae TaxID=328185 RepID=A0AAW2IC25_9NEOP